MMKIGTFILGVLVFILGVLVLARCDLRVSEEVIFSIYKSEYTGSEPERKVPQNHSITIYDFLIGRVNEVTHPELFGGYHYNEKGKLVLSLTDISQSSINQLVYSGISDVDRERMIEYLKSDFLYVSEVSVSWKRLLELQEIIFEFSENDEKGNIVTSEIVPGEVIVGVLDDRDEEWIRKFEEATGELPFLRFEMTEVVEE
jgi:hypothetical protein